MTVQFHEIDGVVKPVAFPDDPGLAGHLGVIWQAQFVDEITGAPIISPVWLRIDDPGLQPVAARGGLAGLVGRPTTLYPDLVGTPVGLSIQAGADGYLPVTLSDTLGAAPDHPQGFSPAGPGIVALRSHPVRLEGRIVQLGAGGVAPVAGADVSVSGLWESAPPEGTNPAPDPAQCVELRPAFGGLAASGTTVRRLTVNATATSTTLSQTAPAGATEVFLADRTGLLPGHLLELDPGDGTRSEMVRITALAQVPPSPFAGRATLTRPLSLDHLEGAAALRRTGAVAGPSRTLTRDAAIGDRSLFVDNAAGLFTTGWVRIGPAADALIYRCRAYSVQSDADGYYQLPPIARIARAFIDVTDGVTSALSVPWTPTHDSTADWLDITLPP